MGAEHREKGLVKSAEQAREIGRPYRDLMCYELSEPDVESDCSPHTFKWHPVACTLTASIQSRAPSVATSWQPCSFKVVPMGWAFLPSAFSSSHACMVHVDHMNHGSSRAACRPSTCYVRMALAYVYQKINKRLT